MCVCLCVCVCVCTCVCVCVCVCVCGWVGGWVKFECTFSTYSPAARKRCRHCQKCLSPVQNTFVCREVSYSDVSSRDYLITSNKHIHILIGSWYKTLQKKQNLGKTVSAKLAEEMRYYKYLLVRDGVGSKWLPVHACV